MATRAYAYAGQEVDEDQQQQYQQPKRRSTKFLTGFNQPHHGFVFKTFNRESLINIQKRKSSKAKKHSATYVDPAKPKPQPDPYLASGQQLPPALVRQLPSDMIGKPIEDIDPYYADQETFVIISRGKELTRFSAAKALYLFGPFHPIRRVVLYILVNPIFNLLVILTILINCILMTIQGSEMVEKTEIIFTIVYTTEMGLKVLARGFIVDEFTYLRDPWNWLDFAVIIMAYLTIVIQDLGNLSVMRTFRVLRALKTVAIIPGMKTIVGAVIDSVKNLKDVVVLTLFSLSVFSLLGLQIYMGQLTQKCILNGPNDMNDTQWFSWCNDSSHWVPEPDDEIFGAYRLCGNATGAQSCPENHTCIQGFGPNPDYGFTNFDTFGWALICSFRLMTQDFWEGLYMQILKTVGSWHIIFFIVSIFLGSIYLMNLILAIVAMSYNELQRRAEEEEEAAAEDEAAFLESCRLMETQEQLSEYSGSLSQNGGTSYRPSVEIGLVGQSLLASLCQNGLLGHHIQEKLNQQMILPNNSPTRVQTNLRSHSLSVNMEHPNQVGPDRLKRASMTTITAGATTAMASSMRELTRRKSSAKSFSNDGRHLFKSISPTRSRRSSVFQHFKENKSPAYHQSYALVPHTSIGSGVLNSSSHQKPQGRETNVTGSARSITSDRDLSILRQRAASIRIVSDDYSTPSTTDLPQDSLVNGAKSLDLTSKDDQVPLTDRKERGKINNRFLNRNSRSLRLHRRPSVASTTTDSPKYLSVDLKSRTKSHDYSLEQYANSRSVNGNLKLQGFAANQQRSGSEAAILTQPKSIHQNEDYLDSNKDNSTNSNISDNSNTYEQQASLNRTSIQETYRPILGGSTLTLHTNQINRARLTRGHSPPTTLSSASNLKQLGVERCLQSGQMHHLSVENFQQFGAVKPVSQIINPANQQQQAGELSGSDEIFYEPLAAPRFGRGRLESRSYIHPSIMMRSSFARPRHSTTGGRLPGMPAVSARRVSQDFVRRASNWSRASMGGNVDLRRLLRLWSHTNPYQGRPSVSSYHSNYSQPGGGSSIAGPDSPVRNSIIGQNSSRLSSVGSTRQAYELISAFNRHHTRYQPDPRFTVPLDDNMSEKISVNGRDKCLAYCLSCLDILCIWECCGAWLKIQHIISIIVFDPFTELFIILCILINTLFMALDSDDADAQMKTIFERGNYFFTATFAVEATMKIMALSPKFYFREGWNVFDSIIVGLSLLELGLEGVYGLSVLRSFRLLRVFKLAKSWPTLNLLISIMGKAVGDLGNLTFVLAIIVFIFAVMGMQLFGNKYVDRNFPSGELPRWNFTDFMHSFMIVFRILCAEWIEPMWDCLLVGGWPCIPFFLIAVTVGNLVVLNLFLALLLASFGASNLSSPQADNVDTKKLQEAIGRFSRFGRWIRKKIGKFSRAITYCCLRRSKNLDGISANRDDSGGDKNKSVKSHIVAMSKLERLKNIELRTEELKSKIRRSPEHHYHLRQLAQSQLKESAKNHQSDTIGCNYHYEHKLPVSPINNQLTSIPIIVDEAETEHDISSYTNDQLEPESHSSEGGSVCNSKSTKYYSDHEVNLHDELNEYNENQAAITELYHSKLREAIQQQTSNQNQSKQAARYSANMQPIREDSRDADSSASLSELDSIAKNRSLDKLAKEELSFSRSRLSQLQCDDLSMTEKESEEAAILEKLINPTVIIDEAKESVHEENQEEVERPKSSLYLKAPKRQDMEEDDEKALQHIESYIEKCICFGIICLKWFLFRQHVRKIVEHRYFDQCILVLIVISSGTLALEDKHLNERPNLKRTLDVLDTIFTIIFSLEMVFKWLAFGMKRYFGNIWSWLDFVIVLVSLVNLMASIFGSGKIQALKTMRTLRAMRGLRPLRALQRFQGMRVVVNALIQAIPSIFNVLLVCLIFWLIFSIMGVQMFGGKFWRCLNPETYKVVPYEEAANRYECIERNLTWANPQINFDNVLNAYLALFQVATFKGWIDIMNSATDSRTRDDQPIREANIYMYFYFVFFVIFGSFFTLNLFIGVIIDNFNEQKKKTGGSLEIFMTEDQKKYYHAMKKMRSKRPIKAMTRPRFKLQAYMFDITTSKKFDMAIMLIIGLNMFVMALEHYGQSQEFSIILENLNLIFIAIFTLECLCKIFAMRHFYFREPWNVFDFIVVTLSILGVVMKEYVAKYFVSPTLLRVVRVVKVGRVLRLVKGAKGIRTLLFALAMSLPALFNICLLLFLVMFIYAIFGMSFFMNVRKRAGIDETFNFETFTSSIIVLFEMSTSAGWDIVLDPLMDEENDCQKPDPVLGIEGTCGNKTIAIIYLISYVIVTFLIIINMYIAVILENYSQATEDVQEGLTDDDYEMYYEIWQKFDPDGTQYLPYEKLSDFVDALEDPLRIPKPNQLALVVLDINIYEGNQCYCVDILDALTKFFFTRKGLVIQVNEHLQKVQSTLHETPFERITTTYLLKRRHYCAKVIQNCWRRWREKVKNRTINNPNVL